MLFAEAGAAEAAVTEAEELPEATADLDADAEPINYLSIFN